ncbi:MAG TPA: hypothetical protein VH188_12910 [Chthoniobacterales bacterium]|jgi:hypothetical protein|nr:hypothetical protein [Chthoniobacterales bacterium]
MQKILLVIALALFASIAGGGEQPPDITGAGRKTLHRHLGKVVSLRGTLSQGVHGESLGDDATKDVPFYIVEDVPPGGFTLPESWLRLHGHQVRVTGILRFRKWPRPPDGKYEGGWSQPPPDYYYMVLQQAQIQPVEAK